MPVRKEKTEPLIVKADTAVKKLYLAALLALSAARVGSAKMFHRRYEIVAQIIEHDPPLYLAGSYATEAEFFAAELNETPQMVHRNIRVMKLATPDEIAKYTATRLHLGIVYFEAKTQTKVTQAIDFKELRIAIKRDGKALNAPLDEPTFAELNAAITQLGDPAKKAPKTEIAKKVEAAMKSAGLKEVKARVTKTQFTLRGPVGSLNAVCRALAEVDVPTE